MFKPGTDEHNVKMSDVLCDFCRREWTEDVPFIEGHQGRVICGMCLAVGFREIVVGGDTSLVSGYECALCRESDADRLALSRAGEPGWCSPAHPDAAVCRRCLKMAAGRLHKDPDHTWKKPAAE